MSIATPPAPPRPADRPSIANDVRPARPAEVVRPTSASPADRDGLDDLLATIALLAFSLTVAAGFARVFSGWAFFDNLAVTAVVGHGLSFALRRLRVPLLLAFPVVFAAVTWLIGAMFYRDTYSLWLPNSDTWSEFRLDLDVVGEQFRTAVAPVDFSGGWDVLAAIGVGAVVLLADTFAFRAYARAEALVPGGVLFVFVAALGSDRSRVALTVALIAAGVVATALLRAHHAPRAATAIGRGRRSIGWILPSAVVAAVVIAALAGVIGPRLPGADEEALLDTKGGARSTVTELESPLVDIRSRLVDQSPTEMFVVAADRPSYWRSAALSEFDGRIWRIPDGEGYGTLERIDGDLQRPVEGSVGIQQTITISNAGGSLLPVAPDPIRASGSDDLRFERHTASLIVIGDGLESGDTFEIDSAAPTYSAEVLAAATSDNPPDQIFRLVPTDLPDVVRTTAVEVMGDATTTFEAAIELQDWFRDNFRYSTEVRIGHDNNALSVFLRDRVGYCEQFAGTYAAMMRSIGIPARVAVGFTWGYDDGTGRYSVRGRNAHAWPEVWFDGLGWVKFEPTPGRGAPDAAYTGLDPDQENDPIDDGTGPEGDEQAVPGPDVTVPTPTIPGGETAPTTLPDFSQMFPDQLDSIDGDGAAGGAGDDGPAVWPFVLAGIVLVLGLLAPTVVRRIRRRADRDPAVEIQRLWARAIRAVETAGVDVRASQTPLETAERTTIVFPTAARPMGALAGAVSEAVYGAGGTDTLSADGTYGTTLIGNCSVWCRQIEKAVDDSISPLERFKRYFTSWS